MNTERASSQGFSHERTSTGSQGFSHERASISVSVTREQVVRDSVTREQVPSQGFSHERASS